LFFSRAGEASAKSARAAPLWVTVLRFGSALGVAFALCAYVSAHFELLYVAYLVLPLLLTIGTALFASDQPDQAAMYRRLRYLGIYAGGTLAFSALILVGYYGFAGAADYGRELFDIITTIQYRREFPALGKPILYLGLNEYYWLQLPWLLTALYGVWLALQRHFGARSYGRAWPDKRREVSAVFLLATLHAFVLYPRSDDMHLFQALLMTVPALFVVLAQLDGFLRQWRPGLGVHFREGVLVLCALYASTIFVQPTLDVFHTQPGDYANARLELLDYRKAREDHLMPSPSRLSDREWDIMLDSTARYVDSITEENEPILVLSDQRLVHGASGTTSVGGRHAFYFYLVSTGLLDREGFDKIVPPEVIQNILDNPPRVIVTFDERNPMMRAFPELRRLRDQRYVHTKLFRYMRVYELKSARSPFLAAHAAGIVPAWNAFPSAAPAALHNR
jgi:hypothetical protein